MAEVDYKFISGHLAKVYYSKLIGGGQMKLRLEIWQRLFISGGQIQLKLGIWQKFIISLLVGDRCS